MIITQDTQPTKNNETWLEYTRTETHKYQEEQSDDKGQVTQGKSKEAKQTIAKKFKYEVETSKKANKGITILSKTFWCDQR